MIQKLLTAGGDIKFYQYILLLDFWISVFNSKSVVWLGKIGKFYPLVNSTVIFCTDTTALSFKRHLRLFTISF